MHHSLPPLNALRAFEAAARHLSFSKAADELHVTAPAISHQIKGLEDYLGLALFHRRNRGLALTPAARAALPKLHQGFDYLSDAVAALREHGRAESVLTVGAAPSFAAKWLLPRLPHFVEQHPDIDLRIAASQTQIDDHHSLETAWDNLRNDAIDMAIRFGNGEYPGCRVDKLFSVSAIPLCSPRLLQGEHPLRRPEDLQFHSLLHDDTVYEAHPDWAAWLKAAGVEKTVSTRGLHFNHAALALQAAIDGQGVVLSLMPLAAADVAAGRLVMPFDLSMPLPYAYYVISPAASAEQTHIGAFRDWLLQEAQSDSEQADKLRAFAA